MAYNYALHLLKIELDKEQKEKTSNEQWFAEKGGLEFYRRYCQNVDRIESLQAAILKLESKDDSQTSY